MTQTTRHKPKSPNDSASSQESLASDPSMGLAEETRPIVLRDGALIQCWVHPGAGTPLVFLYGLGCSRFHWKYQVREAQMAGRLTVQIDYRGHGKSTIGSPLRPLSIRTLSHDVAEASKQLGISESVILGQSMGGNVALQLASDYPNLVKALVLQASPGREPFARMRLGRVALHAIKFMTTLNRRAPNLTRRINSSASKAKAIVREIVRRQGFNAELAKSEDIDEYIAHFFANDPNIFYELIEDLADFNISHFKRPIECPTLIISGARDNVVPVEECQWLARRLPGAELEVIAHGSHCPHLEDPKLVNKRIWAFLKTYDL
jgi:pimeloyl-ACP methyl ester carboxylesterase